MDKDIEEGVEEGEEEGKEEDTILHCNAATQACIRANAGVARTMDIMNSIIFATRIMQRVVVCVS